jgi:hypothetical protein
MQDNEVKVEPEIEWFFNLSVNLSRINGIQLVLQKLSHVIMGLYDQILVTCGNTRFY